MKLRNNKYIAEDFNNVSKSRLDILRRFVPVLEIRQIVEQYASAQPAYERLMKEFKSKYFWGSKPCSIQTRFGSSGTPGVMPTGTPGGAMFATILCGSLHKDFECTEGLRRIDIRRTEGSFLICNTKLNNIVRPCSHSFRNVENSSLPRIHKLNTFKGETKHKLPKRFFASLIGEDYC